MLTPEDIRLNLRATMQERKYNTEQIRELAIKVGYHPDSIYRFLRGETKPKFEFLQSMCREIGIDPETGLPFPEPEKKRFKGRLKRGVETVSKKPPKYGAMLQEEKKVVEELPSEIDLSEEEVRTILEARKGPRDVALLRVRMVAMGIHACLAEGISYALEGNYLKAMERLAQMAQNGNYKKK